MTAQVTGSVVAIGLALLAVRLGLSGRGRRTLRRLAPHEDARSSPPRSVAGPHLGVAGAGLVALLVIVLLFAGWQTGAQGVLSCIGAIGVIWTATRLVARSRSRNATRIRRGDVSQACAVLAGQVRIGLVPSVALASAAEDCPVLQPAMDTLALGGDPVACWLRQAETAGLSGLADLARAWQLSVATGAELAPTLDAVAEALSRDRALDLVIAAETSAPRATGRIMAVLPLVGIGLGYVMGGNPLTFLLGTAAGRACLAIGALFACGGVLWMERVAERGAVDP